MRKSSLLLISGLILGWLSVWPNFVLAQDNTELNFFYSETCPHCAKEKAFLNDLEKKHPDLEINRYEVVSDKENQKLLADFYERFQVPANEQGLVPATFLSKQETLYYFIGFNDQIKLKIEQSLGKGIPKELGNYSQNTLSIPIFGKIDIGKVSLPALTIILGLLDGFNPCAMWILLVLITMLLTLRSRRKIALVGGIFILTEGLLYFLFMSAWLNFFEALSFVSFIRIGIGIFGIIFGILRIRDFMAWKPGVCKVVGVSGKDKLFDRINKVLKPATLPATILGVASLAFGVNLVEFFCSAGFPVIYTKILASQGLSALQHYLYLAFYNVLYMLDDLIVFGAALFTLSRFGFSDKYNRWSTLAAGILILALGLFLIFKPEFLMFA